jgi:hypothetical protein
MEEKRLRLGELLIEAGVLNDSKLQEALALQRQQPRPLGQILVEAALVTEAQLIQALSRQLSIPWVSLWHVDVAPELLAIVTREEAEKYRLLPIYARTVRGERPALFVAMDDPTHQEALEFVREAAGMEVRPMIAAPTDLRQAIIALYSGEEEEEAEEAPPPPPPIASRRSSPPPPPRAARRSAEQHEDALELTEPADDDEEEPGEDEAAAEAAAPPAGGAETSGASAPRTETTAVGAAPKDSADQLPGSADLEEGMRAASGPPPESAPYAVPPASAPAPAFLVPGAIEGGAEPPDARPRDVFEAQAEKKPRPRQSRALAFTFLDGTSIAIGGSSGAGADDGVKLGQLVATLRRFSDDPNVPEPYGPRGLSRIVAAILEVLEKKALLTEEELSEAMGRPPPDR